MAWDGVAGQVTVTRGALAVALLMIGAIGCDGSRDPGRMATDVVPAVIPPQAQCAGLDECACVQTPGCAPITTECWCAAAQCGTTAACACQGGRFLACSPVGGGCHTSPCPLLAEPSAPDERGCITCVGPDTCAATLTKLAAACPALPEDETQWMCSAGLAVCTSFCLGQIGSCASAECAACLGACSCADDTVGSCVDECLSSMALHH